MTDSTPADVLTTPIVVDDDEMEVLEGFTFDAVKYMWVCDRCDSYVASPFNHAEWHKSLDIRMTG